MNLPFPTAVAVALLAGLLIAAPASGATALGPAHGFVPHQLIVKFEGERHGRAVKLSPGTGVREAVASLRRSPGVAYAAPNHIAIASVTAAEQIRIPNDPGPLTSPLTPGGWVTKQWNFLPWEGPGTPELPASPGGIDAPAAWEHLAALKRPGAKGITVAVLDTGVAYRSEGKRFKASPDFTPGQFAKGHDFVDDDALPLDENGHGTHVAGTIAEKTNNGIGLAGIAYRAKLIPVRVLDRFGRGRADEIAKGIRFAVDHGADVINMSFNFGCDRKVPGVDEALRYAYRKGVVTVASVGNLGSEACVAPPATGPQTIGVGGTTEGGCLGSYSLAGDGVDLLAPGGGTAVPACPSVSASPIYQVTLKTGSTRRFGEPSDYVGTSMAAAHVSAVAAMVIAADTYGGPRILPPPKKEPEGLAKSRVKAVAKRLRTTARSLELPEVQQGAGLIDAGRATDPAVH